MNQTYQSLRVKHLEVDSTKAWGLHFFLTLIMKLITIIRGEHRDINQKTSIILKCSSRSRCTKITDFPTLSNTSTFENPTLLYTWGL